METRYMKMALKLARKGLGRTSPNPAVGAIVIKEDRVIGRGYHKKAGFPHAEIEALKEAGGDADSAEMYVTLEPCRHTGRTPPCTDAIIKAGIKRVFIGTKDPNPLMAGKGIRSLRKAGVDVKTGLLEDDCIRINEAYNKYIRSKLPFITLKLAATLDGKIATLGGESRWITSEPARRHVHRMRSRADAIMVGIGTVLRDNPELTTRHVTGKDPIRFVVDSDLEIPLDAKVFTAKGGRLIVATTRKADSKKMRMAEERGAMVLKIPSAGGGVNLKRLIAIIGEMEITSLLIEGGSRLAASFIKEKIVDKFCFFYAPRIIGEEGMPMVGELGIRSLKDSFELRDVSVRGFDRDIMVEGYR
ncbi:MAG: bifunctional diaminohydroxyphosphoribosylaminopyrimidine deaminase/5-amino-6-(5-phosphoribosylamino)uracil reductase RibD [Thermodesulfobacteriota bacterium]